MRDSFILYTKYSRQLQCLTYEQKGVLLSAIFAYEMDEELPEMDAHTYVAFNFIAVDLDENARRYEEKCEKNKENGKLGGRPRKPKVTEKTERFSENRTQAKKAYSDNDNDNDNDSDNEDDNDSLKEKVSESKIPQPKRKHGAYKHVLLKDQEYEKLLADYGDKAEEAITFLDEYIEEKGYKSKSHYLAIKRWVLDALKPRGKPKDSYPRLPNGEIDWSRV